MILEVNEKNGRKRIIHKPKPAWMGPPRDPPEHGKLTIPQGKEDCLDGLVFVVTGLSKYLTVQEISDLIFDHGGFGRIVFIIHSVERTAVSGKTNYLVAGFEMEDGRKITEGAQYKAAIKKKVKIISDEDLVKMIEKSIEKKEEEKK